MNELLIRAEKEGLNWYLANLFAHCIYGTDFLILAAQRALFALSKFPCIVLSVLCSKMGIEQIKLDFSFRLGIVPVSQNSFQFFIVSIQSKKNWQKIQKSDITTLSTLNYFSIKLISMISVIAFSHNFCASIPKHLRPTSWYS